MRMAEEFAQEEVMEEEISIFKPPFKVGDPVLDFEILSFQGCTENQCLPPKKQEFTLSFDVVQAFENCIACLMQF